MNVLKNAVPVPVTTSLVEVTATVPGPAVSPAKLRVTNEWSVPVPAEDNVNAVPAVALANEFANLILSLLIRIAK